MGNANSHVNESRRKSTSGDSIRGQPVHYGGERPRRYSGGYRDHISINPEQRGAMIGPVDITKPPGKSPNKLLSTTGSALSRTVRGFRPRSGTGDSTAPRARANTVSMGQRPKPRRHATVDVPETKDSSGNRMVEDCGHHNRKDSCQLDSTPEGFMTTNPADAHKKLPTIFKFSAPSGSKDVYVSGSFNNWQKLKMCPSTKDFIAIVDLKEGEHEYRFYVDGQWKNDPSEPMVDNKEMNGVRNNVIRVQKEDFDAYHALDMDSKAVATAQNSHKKRLFADTFSQDIPPYVSQSEYRSGPPILPPHLNQVILNKDTPLSCEPTLLPEPKHVMLNHLYALSIKDGVMVLSSTQRFKHKYVTTLLYKPMGIRKTA